jgi:O-antigen ligase
LLSFVCCIGFLIILGIVKFYKWLSNKITTRTRADRKIFIKWVLPIVFSIVLITCVLGLFLSAGFVLSKIDWRMAALLDPKTYISKDWFQIANEMVFAERIVFWQTGMKVFNDYPLLGVGLGNNGYFFPQKFDGYAWSLPEVQSIVNSDRFIPNAKNFWVRLLSETGVIGFAFFIGWLVILWISAGHLSRSVNKIDQVISLMGRLAIIAFFFEGFSIDTFGLPYIWISLGLITASWTRLVKTQKASIV